MKVVRLFFDKDYIRRRRLREKLPGAYRRWPLLAGVAAGLWVCVIAYLGRLVLSLIHGHGETALFSLLWSALCFVLWGLLHNWARKYQAG
ncbi:MAG: hypothetical protein FVQ81_07380 [Candidatus Glassbacteria bacterium]|nr:hypothetical protein [Candidatus Glassbacteria bacterium]